jgi:hypothetical protein
VSGQGCLLTPATTYELVWDERRYPPKAILGTAYEFATGQRLGSGDFEGGKTTARSVFGRHQPATNSRYRSTSRSPKR